MADNPNPDHLRGWGAPTADPPDPLTPEERAAVESIRGDWQDARVAAMRAALDRLAPKPVQPEPEDPIRQGARLAIGWAYAECKPAETMPEFADRAMGDLFGRPEPTPDPDREAREALDTALGSGLWRKAIGITGQLAALRAHGFTHRSEGARNDFAACYRAMVRAQNDATLFADLLEAAWCVIANVSEGNWEKQPDDWRDAAARWRDRWLATIPRKPESSPPVAPPPAAVDVVREALNFCGYAGTGAAALTAALAARGVTFPTGA